MAGVPSSRPDRVTAKTALLAPALASCCEHSPDSRNCWGEYNISTDYYETVPDTGVTRTYYLSLNNLTMAPDGVPVNVFAFNDSIPGPLITADWGDWVEIYVTNNLQNNGTSIHWHGLRQLGTVASDGVPGVTQCAIPPGHTFKYRWRAAQHILVSQPLSLQYGLGCTGQIVINGPATANYDVDLGPLSIQDWYHQSAFYLWTGTTVPPPPGDNGLLNGKNKFNGSGEYFSTTVEPGKTYRLRIINTGTFAHMKFSIDNHTFYVIANDLVPVHPYQATVIDVALAQRYDIVFTADQAATNYWIRAVPQLPCTNNKNPDGIRGILRYSTAENPEAEPTTTGYNSTGGCGDLTMSLTPYVSKTIAASRPSDDRVMQLTFAKTWFINGVTQVLDWGNPSLGMVEAQNASYPSSFNVVALNGTAADWAFFQIQSSLIANHPLHIHGHDWFVLSRGPGNFSGNFSDFTTMNLPRRDVVVLPSKGHVAVAFPLDNPGTWLMHCHIAFHASEGLSLQFVERHDEIRGNDAVDDGWRETCEAWKAYTSSNDVEMDDSGI
ncbi:laccase-1 precursor [Zopfochytrium polystomum]|nr:laccase-1 precursor [Zopfochytrium polystomum]